MELARPEQMTCHGRTPTEIARAAEVCDDVLDMLATESDADQALLRGIIDERLHLLGSVAVHD
jgi:hypothetical protein